jgi:hypothetical protein
MLPAGCHPDKPARSAANPFHWAIEAASTSAAAFEQAPDRWMGWGWLRAEHRRRGGGARIRRPSSPPATSGDHDQIEAIDIAAARHRLMTLGSTCEAHVNGLRVLECDRHIDPEAVQAMIVNDDSLMRRYGAVAASRLAAVFPDLVDCLQSSNDADLCDFFA